MVDHRLWFWDISVGWPGKVSDATFFGNSSLYERGQSGSLFPHITERFEGESVPVAILGDAAYPLLPWLITPDKPVVCFTISVRKTVRTVIAQMCKRTIMIERGAMISVGQQLHTPVEMHCVHILQACSSS